MASKRKRKKAYDCAHHVVGENFLVTDDPYPIYNHEDYCACGKFNWTWGNHRDEEFPCEECRKFKVTKKMTRKVNKEKKKERRIYKFSNFIDKKAKILNKSVDDVINMYE